MKEYKYTVKNFIRLGLFALCIVFSILLWRQINAPLVIKDDKPDHQKAVSTLNLKSDIQNFPLQEIAAFDEIIERPLFNETRRPFVAAKVEPVKQAPPKKRITYPQKQEQLALSAVVITPEKQVAILQTGSDKNLRRIALGETINGWTLDQIAPDTVRLTRDDEIRKLDLEIKGSAAKKSPGAEGAALTSDDPLIYLKK